MSKTPSISLPVSMDNTELVPQHFVCPISLQIMKDPVTTISGITYDRESIEHWMFKNQNTLCPVTKQSLPGDAVLTPNHTLRRLIQAWSTANESYGRFYVVNLIRELSLPNFQLKLNTLQKLEAIAAENDRTRAYMVEAGLGKKLISFIISCYKNGETNGLKEALSILYIIRVPLGQILTENDEIIDSLMWVFGFDHKTIKFHAAYVLKALIQKVNPGILERLKPEFFRSILFHIRNSSPRETNALLHVLLEACPWARNRVNMVGSGAVFDLIEVELRSPDKKTTELVLGILYHLCSCAEGRAELLGHAAGIAVVTRRILKISAAADDRAVMIIWLICKYLGTNGVLQEMLRVGTVAKLCMVMQANTASYLKEKARAILRRYYDAWKDSPCIEVPTLTRYTR